MSLSFSFEIQFLKYNFYIHWEVQQYCNFAFYQTQFFKTTGNLSALPQLSSFLMFHVSFHYLFLCAWWTSFIAIILESICWQHIFLVFCQLKMCLFIFHSWSIHFLVGVHQYWSNTAFFFLSFSCSWKMLGHLLLPSIVPGENSAVIQIAIS